MWEVIVGNIGLVFQDRNGFEARQVYNQYVKKSRDQDGRAAGENVTLMCGGEIVLEHNAQHRGC